MHHSKSVSGLDVIDTPKGTILIDFKKGFDSTGSVFEIELSPFEVVELIADLKNSLNNLSIELFRLSKEV